MTAMTLVEADAVMNAANGTLSGTSVAVADLLKAYRVVQTGADDVQLSAFKAHTLNLFKPGIKYEHLQNIHPR